MPEGGGGGGGSGGLKLLVHNPELFRTIEPLICLEPCWSFLAHAAVRLKAGKTILPKYGIREFQG